ncbi:ABC transporter permease [Clostridium sp.]|uniref:ABC transporter permease n=1 Tax=Clostridium sp. TaxID=1506 RepID=UPI0034645AC3
MNWFKDIIKALLKRKVIYALLFIQLSLSMYNAYDGIITWKAYRSVESEGNSFKEINNMYFVRFNFSNILDGVSPLRFNISEELKAKSKYEIVGFNELENDIENDYVIDYIVVDSNIVNVFQFNTLEGRKEFNKDKPQALVGYRLKDKYNIGDKIKHNRVGEEIEVIGFLDKNHSTFDEYGSNLDNSIVILDDDTLKITNTCLVYSKDGYSKTKKEVAKILGEHGTINFTDLEEEHRSGKEYVEKQTFNIAMYSIGMFIFSLGVFISLLILIINKSKRDIGIKIACGAKKISIYTYMLGQILSIYLLSSFVALTYIYVENGHGRKSPFTMDYISVINIAGIIFIFIVSIPILMKIIKLKPSELIKNQ